MTDHEPDPTVGIPSSSSESPTLDSYAASIGGSPREGPGSVIGPYKILKLIGEGGFGSVFLAEQEKPVARQIALKVIKLGMDTLQVVARFEQERQALAILDHPHIAKVFDAGATDSGRPYFVMELCAGQPIDAFCDAHNLSVAERLELFGQVCAAVQHAHTKGLIHRDIKPSNVLVAMQDGMPSARVIDFGIAKATAGKLTERTLFTEHQLMIGTPEYMSPEQAEGSLDIDTRTDVYALGVLLYELLAGSTPFTSKEIRSAGYAEIQRMIGTVNPPRPSTRLGKSVDTLADVAARRRIEPRKLVALLRGDLDWIVMTAIDKDRQRRYETANGLAMDIRRYLAGEAVMAAPPSRAYRVKKFVRRNRVMVTAGSAVAAALLLGAVAFAWQASVARDQRDLATREAKRANQEAHTASLTLDFLTELFRIVDPGEARGNTVTAREVLDRGAGRIQTELRDEPEVRASLMGTMGMVYTRLGLYPAALPLLRDALAERRGLWGDDDERVAESRHNLGVALQKSADLDGAERELRAAVDARRRLLGRHRVVADSLDALAEVLCERGQCIEAEALARESLDLRRALQGRHADVAKSLDVLAFAMSRLHKTEGVEDLLREAVELNTEFLGTHPETASVLSNLGTFLYESQNASGADVRQERLDEVASLFQRSLDMKRQVFGAVHPEVALGLNNLAFVLQDKSDLDGAEKHFREAIEQQRKLLGDAHPDLGQALNNLAFVHHARGNDEAARESLVEAVAVYRRALGDEHAGTLGAISNLGNLLLSLGKLTEAEPCFREVLSTSRRVLGKEHPGTLQAIVYLGALLSEQGRHAEVIALLTPAEPAARKAFAGPGTHRLGSLLMNLGKARAALAKDSADFAAAEPNLLEAHASFLKTRDEKHKSTRDCVQALADLYAAWDKAEPGKGYDAKAAEWRAKLEAAK